MLHALLYLGIAIAYCESAAHDLMKGNRRDAIRYAVITVFYISIAFVVLDPRLAEVQLIPSAETMLVIA
jgi:hypothetical protein